MYISCLITSSVNVRFIYYQKIKNEEIITQIVRISEVCDENGKNNKSCQICNVGLKKFFFVKYETYGTLYE